MWFLLVQIKLVLLKGMDHASMGHGGVKMDHGDSEFFRCSVLATVTIAGTRSDGNMITCWMFFVFFRLWDVGPADKMLQPTFF